MSFFEHANYTSHNLDLKILFWNSVSEKGYECTVIKERLICFPFFNRHLTGILPAA